MSIHSRHVIPGSDYQGEIPSGAVRLILNLGVQASGKVKVGDGDEQPLYYGKNEYVTQGANTYSISSEQDIEVVEDFIYMPAGIDAYMEQRFNELSAPMVTKLEDHETRITKLEARPGPPA